VAPRRLAGRAFRVDHGRRLRWRQIWGNNPFERRYGEVKRRTDVVGICPNAAAIFCLVGRVLAEQYSEWQIGRRYCSTDSLARLATGVILESDVVVLLAAAASA
jgi:transposase-like protein